MASRGAPAEDMPLDPRFKPTAYSAALLQAGLRELGRRPVASALEIGVGGGVVMAGLLQSGVGHFTGVDILPEAVRTCRTLLAKLNLQDRADLDVSSLWDGLDGRKFDLIVCNPPQFPLQAPLNEEHPPAWSDGGPDGRLILGPLLAGLATHLQPDGVALVTHNAFVGLSTSCDLLRHQGLMVEPVSRVMVPLSDERRDALAHSHPNWGQTGRPETEPGVVQVGPQCFVEFVVLRAAWADGCGAAPH